MSGQISEQTILQELAGRLARSVDEATCRRALWHIVDWVGCAFAGVPEPAGQILRECREESPAGDVFFWGGLGGIVEMDDVDKRALLHPGPAIVPAALIYAEQTKASGSALLQAIVRGYEASIRLGRAAGPAHYALWHSTGTCTPIGAAAACASLGGLDEVETAHAMALAMSQAAGLWQTRHEPLSMGKQLHTAHAARAGYQATRLAAKGFRGPLSILEGVQGFFAATCPGANPADVLVADDANWVIHDVSFKPWPACRHAHAVIDAALELKMAAAPVDGEIHVRTYGDALRFCDKPDPQTESEAKFSLQHAVAVCLERGEPKLEDFGLASLADPRLANRRARVRVFEAEPYASAYPDRFGAEISMGGHTAKVPDALGDPENPISEAQIRAKAVSLIEAGGQSRAYAEDVISEIKLLSSRDATLPLAQKIRQVLA